MKNENFPYKICIPYKDQPQGGVYTFLNYFKKYLDKNNILYTENLFSLYDILFINSFKTPYYKVKFLKLLRPKLKVVQRIDGAAQDYGRGIEWDFIQKKVNTITDLTVFQSQYGRFATKEKFSVIGNDGPVIHNAVDLELFKPLQKKHSASVRPRIANVAFSTNLKKGASRVLEIAQKNPDIDFILIGRFSPDDRLKLKNVHCTGLLNRKEVAQTLGSCHMFFFYSQNEACPNVVIEAMSCGLPLLYLDSGATSELVGNTGEKITVDSFKIKFEKIWKNWQEWSLSARKRAENNFSIEKIISKYLKAMLKI